MARLVLVGAFLVMVFSGCSGREMLSSSSAESRSAGRGEDPIMKAIEMHLGKGRRDVWDLGPDYSKTGGEPPDVGKGATAPGRGRPSEGKEDSLFVEWSPAMKRSAPPRPLPGRDGEGGEKEKAAPGLPVPEVPYRLRSGDEVNIAVSGYPELSGTARVRSDGTVVLPGSGVIVRGTGMTPEGFAELAAAAMEGKVLKVRPKVSVEVERGPEYFVFVRLRSGDVKAVPASEAPTLGALLARLALKGMLRSGERFRVSYPSGGGRLTVGAEEAFEGAGRGLPLCAGAVVELVGPGVPDKVGMEGMAFRDKGPAK